VARVAAGHRLTVSEGAKENCRLGQGDGRNAAVQTGTEKEKIREPKQFPGNRGKHPSVREKKKTRHHGGKKKPPTDAMLKKCKKLLSYTEEPTSRGEKGQSSEDDRR